MYNLLRDGSVIAIGDNWRGQLGNAGLLGRKRVVPDGVTPAMKEGCEKAGLISVWKERLEGFPIGFMDCYPPGVSYE